MAQFRHFVAKSESPITVILADAPPSVAVQVDSPKNTFHVSIPSLSRKLIVLPELRPIPTPSARDPKPMCKLSPSSSSSSGSTLTVNYASVSPAAKFTFGGKLIQSS